MRLDWPIRPSEMKDEGCVFPSHSSCVHRVVWEGRCVPKLPSSRVYGRVRQLLSCSVHAYESLLCYMRLPDIIAILDGIAPHVPSLILHLATKMSKLTAILRYVALLRLRLCPALHLSTSVAYLHSGTIWHHYSKMFVGGLSWGTTDEGLQNYFSEFVKVDACMIVRDADGKSREFAFLTFEDPASVNAVVVQEHFLGGKAIDPKRAIPREEHLRNTRYFVGVLAPQTTADSMRPFFSKFGKVVDVTVMVDRETGRSKGFGLKITATTLSLLASWDSYLMINRCVYTSSVLCYAASFPSLDSD
ncbi:hypothetical protein BJV78DRAFT_680490 [Lactifluus subvellereus]|nr:hypothetical protein BJV78DRAFT_680490 [Lactifluus subvellereus]